METEEKLPGGIHYLSYESAEPANRVCSRAGMQSSQMHRGTRQVHPSSDLSAHLYAVSVCRGSQAHSRVLRPKLPNVNTQEIPDPVNTNAKELLCPVFQLCLQ